MGEIFLYNHGGSGNHGCEALVRTVSQLLSSEKKITVYSESPHEDIHYGIHEIASIEPAIQPSPKLSLDFMKAYLRLKITGDYFDMDILPYLKSIRQMKKGDIEVSVGGDIYCYEDYPKFIRLHQLIRKRGCKTVLLGCSLDEKLFEDSYFLEDMRTYDYISARESLTFNRLKKVGLRNIGLAPDSAFTLPIEKLPLPAGFIEGNTVGINVSPLVVKKEISLGIVQENYRTLIQWILDTTNCAVALIPHAVWEGNDDRTVLQELKEYFPQNDRVIMVPDCNCMQLKGYISRCRFFVGARTHATIAAYSTGVPTLVVGYSIKSRGIATDLFGMDEGYVLPIECITDRMSLTHAFTKLYAEEQSVAKKLNEIMPEYTAQVKIVKECVNQAR